MTVLLLARHGETDWNRELRWQGHSDTPLNERGRAQARQLADAIDVVDVVYASDLARARETAEIVARRRRVDVRTDPRLRERGFGSWEGLTMEEIERAHADAHRRWLAGRGHGADDAEPFDVFAARVHAFVSDVLERHPSERVLVVAHGGTIRVVHCLAAGLDYVRDHRSIPSIANCAIAAYSVRNGSLVPAS